MSTMMIKYILTKKWDLYGPHKQLVADLAAGKYDKCPDGDGVLHAEKWHVKKLKNVLIMLLADVIEKYNKAISKE